MINFFAVVFILLLDYNNLTAAEIKITTLFCCESLIVYPPETNPYYPLAQTDLSYFHSIVLNKIKRQLELIYTIDCRYKSNNL